MRHVLRAPNIHSPPSPIAPNMMVLCSYEENVCAGMENVLLYAGQLFAITQINVKRNVAS